MVRFSSVVLAFFLAAGGAAAATYQVNTTSDFADASPGDGVCGTLGVCSLRAAVQEANAWSGADTIVLPAGTYTLTRAGRDENAALTGDLDVAADLEIVGAGPSLSVVNANRLDRVIHVLSAHEPELSLRGLTITGGEAVSATSYLGGGIFAEWSGTLRMRHCAVTGNTANSGGGLYLGETAAEISHSSFSGNASENLGYTNEGGAAIHGFEAGSSLSLAFSTVTGNSNEQAQRFSVELENASWFSVENSTITQNQAGGLRSYNSDATVVSTTIADNGHVGISFGSYAGNNSLVLVNTIIGGLPTCDIYNPGTYVHAGNLESADNCGLDTGAGEMVWTNPDLGPLASNGGPTMTRVPNPGSPALDAGTGPPACTANDQRGVSRPEDGDGDGVVGCDIGAAEAADLLFVDTFDSADCSFWSAMSP